MSVTDETPTDDRLVTSVRMTKRQWQNLGIGLAFLGVGIGVFAVLKFLEGNVVRKDGEEYVYTVDPNVFLIMVVIAFIGLLIVMLTIVDHRWQARSGDNDVRITDLIRKKAPEPAQQKYAEPARNSRPEKMQEKAPRKKETVPPQKKKPEPVREKVPDMIVRSEPEAVWTKVVEPARELVPVPMARKEPEPMQRMETIPEKAIELDPVIMTEPEPIPIERTEHIPVDAVPPPILSEAEPVQADLPEPMMMNASEPPEPEGSAPVKVEAIGRCPMCSNAILLDQKECVKCGLRVDRRKLLPLEH